MCLWIRDQKTPNSNEVTLTYSIVHNDKGKCRGCCSSVYVAPGNPFEDEDTSCDEALFAKTYEALNLGAHIACVDEYENNF
jgi:hypothetical protein